MDVQYFSSTKAPRSVPLLVPSFNKSTVLIIILIGSQKIYIFQNITSLFVDKSLIISGASTGSPYLACSRENFQYY